MEAVLQSGAAEAAVIADLSPEMAIAAQKLAPQAEIASSLDDLLARDIDGLVIATPSALHAQQAVCALERGIAVFCQKPLGRTASEVTAVVSAARQADALLCVDLSYRFTAAMRRIKEVIDSGELGQIFAVDLVFHNAYGPDKAWFYNPALSGGGCVMDLGVHLVDLALWVLGFPKVPEVSSRLFAGGQPIDLPSEKSEDYAIASLVTETGAAVRLACSWRLHAGCDAVIDIGFHGTQGGAALHNVNGSFYDFIAERYHDTTRETLAVPPDSWGGRAAADWAARLAAGERFDPASETLIDVARILDRIYQRH